MATIPIIAAVTAAVATQVDFPSVDYSRVWIAADALATTEKVQLFFKIGTVYKAVTDALGAAVTLTATAPTYQLDGGPIYAVTKDATAGACGVYALTGSLSH